MELVIGLLLAVAGANEVNSRYPQFPSYEVCDAGRQACQKDHRQIQILIPWIEGHSPHPYADVYKDALREADRIWECWHQVAIMKRHPVGSWESDEARERLRPVLSEEDFHAGRLPFPLSWR